MVGTYPNNITAENTTPAVTVGVASPTSYGPIPATVFYNYVDSKDNILQNNFESLRSDPSQKGPKGETGPIGPAGPAGIGANIVSVPTSEALSAGAVVNLFTNNAGAVNARNADGSVSTGGKKVSGFVIVAVAAGSIAQVYRYGLNNGVTGLTPGADYYLGTTPGTITATPPSAAGQTQQYIGTAISATSIDIQPAPFVGIT